MSRTYRTKEQARTYWQGILKRWRQSGLTAHQFCRVHKIHDSGFYTWRKKLALPHSSNKPDKTPDSSFVQIGVQSSTHSPLTLQLVSGNTLHIAHQVDSDTLAKVIRALREARLC